MSASRGQASTLIVGAIAFSVVISFLVGGGLSLNAVTNDLNLNEVSNNGDRDVPAISYVAVCFEGDVPPETFDVDSIEISFSDEREDGEFFATSFTYSGDLTPAFIIIKGGQLMEQFTPNGVYTFGDGDLVEPANPNNAPCGEGYWGVKQEEDGEEELVYVKGGGPNGPNGPGNGNGVIALA